MTERDQLLLSNALDALDRLSDGVASVIDIQALLFATGEALQGTSHLPYFELPATELVTVIRSRETAEAKRNRALSITHELRLYLADLDTDLIT